MSEAARPIDAPQPVLLVVDDEPLNRDLLRRLLFHDYEILEGGDAAEAETVLQESGIVEVLICDHIMPGPSGVELAATVRARWPNVVTVLLTGYEDAPEITAAREAGLIFAVMAKPWVAAQLRETVGQAVKRARALAAGEG